MTKPRRAADLTKRNETAVERRLLRRLARLDRRLVKLERLHSTKGGG